METGILKVECEFSSGAGEELTQGGRRVGSWSWHENLLYVIFLDLNKLIMASKKKRKNSRIFDRMSEFVTTRNSLQCRSHHQKLIEKLGDVKTIVVNFKKLIGKEAYRQQYLQLRGGKDRRKATEESQPVKMEEVQEPMESGEVEKVSMAAAEAGVAMQCLPYAPFFYGNPLLNYNYYNYFSLPSF